jgi:low affinity Fe/Cu permease
MARARNGNAIGHALERFSGGVTSWTGSTSAFGLALGIIIVWGITGPLFKYSDTWQLVINTGTTIVTFLMVFLIQRSQNKDALAIHIKLNELVAAVIGASNRLIDVESLTEEELRTLQRHFHQLALEAKRAADVSESHSVEEAHPVEGATTAAPQKSFPTAGCGAGRAQPSRRLSRRQ